MIKFKNVSKKYKNKTLALNNINLNLREGEVIGILGPNGSGKTTLLKMIQGFLKPTSGEVTIDDEIVGAKTKAIVSYLPDSPFLPKDYKIKEAKKLFKIFFDDFRESKFEELLKFMELNEDMKVGDLSKGMNEKLHLSLILSRDAKYYIIDEPIAGVDLVSRDRIMEAIFSNIDDDKTLVITTHLVDEMENLFDRAIYISNGEIALEGQADDLRQKHNKSLSDIFREIFGHIY